MTDSKKDQPDEFDDLEPIPAEAELVEMPDDVELVELTAEAELAELPDDVSVELMEMPEEAKVVETPKPVPAVKPQAIPAAKPKPTPKPAPKPAPVAKPKPAAPAPEPVPAAAPAAATPATTTPATAPPATAGADAKPVVSSSGGGSRRERMDKEKEARQSKKKVDHWVRWEGTGEKPKREMEKAPALLRKAALGLLIGCLLPWGGYTVSWTGNIGEKLLVLAGLYVWHQSHLLRDGVKVPGFIKSMGAKKFLPLFIMAGILTLVGFMPVFSMASLSGDGVKENLGPFAEKGFLILAGLTLTHIYDYQHGGKFNPMFPIMFLAPGIAGVMAILKVFSADPITIGHMLGGLGAVLVGIAGWMSAYTMYVAMKEAKAHGDAKKKAQSEARKAARAQRK